MTNFILIEILRHSPCVIFALCNAFRLNTLIVKVFCVLSIFFRRVLIADCLSFNFCFHRNELFISCSEATFSFDDVIGKCVVLYVRDYFACRPTEMPEKDIFLFESKHIQAENMIRKIKSAKRYAPSFKVTTS